MAEGSYEYECMRAELLGIDKPDFEEFTRRRQQQQQQTVHEEEVDTENLKEVDLETDANRRIAGGLDELNTILQVTQKKINKFKASCGSLTNLLKFKIGHGSSSDSLTGPAGEERETEEEHKAAPAAISEVSVNGGCGGGPRRSDLARALDNHVDGLDAMIEKAESAQCSMARQNKEMKRLLQ